MNVISVYLFVEMVYVLISMDHTHVIVHLVIDSMGQHVLVSFVQWNLKNIYSLSFV
jgi:hypothetical protein